ncbi:type I 3-dehydroquinate dehydratase [Coxiella endosymbiont of Amblyomma americanum]|uniref:type I 3-dehydroquinate dehydratase n=1 Tax=Coxiella endosymbiont of Amblyomma americanum TaxID=325775 RepID=UPI00057DD321|nr:type I 3-dehydroquinate dehydratase [Coxiella endosymbiont of Amblyomma americanum]AJC50671.1 3-dehydroquinate dehydratase [Coxiella endosymbiont of Amblyomma americanum]AUJ58995.1 3-dehydroquinase [Coxiella-like endosymbiont of Amblyomma americanum]
MSNVNICISVTGKTLETFLLQLKQSQHLVDIIELRVDCIKNINLEMLCVISEHTKKKSILCCRSKKDGGNFEGTVKEQNEILQMGNTLGFNYLDIDLLIAKNIVIRNKKAKFIISYHNFVETPNFGELKKIAMRMRNYEPDILKFSVMINSRDDIKTLFRFLLNKRENENMIVLGMGKKGKIVRLLTPFFGGYLTFSSLSTFKEAHAAPGQIPYQIMEKFYNNFQEILYY